MIYRQWQVNFQFKQSRLRQSKQQVLAGETYLCGSRQYHARLRSLVQASLTSEQEIKQVSFSLTSCSAYFLIMEAGRLKALRLSNHTGCTGIYADIHLAANRTVADYVTAIRGALHTTTGFVFTYPRYRILRLLALMAKSTPVIWATDSKFYQNDALVSSALSEQLRELLANGLLAYGRSTGNIYLTQIGEQIVGRYLRQFEATFRQECLTLNTAALL